MKTYIVQIPYCVTVTAEVEAENKEQAIEIAFDDATIMGFCGNGGSDKLIGVCGENVSIECGDGDIDGIGPFEIIVEEA